MLRGCGSLKRLRNTDLNGKYFQQHSCLSGLKLSVIFLNDHVDVLYIFL